MIELKNVSKSFDGIEALKNVSVTVREGEVFGLIGTNGAGKSTLLRLACGVFKPDPEFYIPFQSEMHTFPMPIHH